jgi:hypothetical protein
MEIKVIRRLLTLFTKYTGNYRYKPDNALMTKYTGNCCYIPDMHVNLKQYLLQFEK